MIMQSAETLPRADVGEVAVTRMQMMESVEAEVVVVVEVVDLGRGEKGWVRGVNDR